MIRTIAALLLSTTLAHGADLPRPLADADFPPVDMDEARLGQLLFYDPILSGNRNISCGTCHHPRFGTSDGLSLGLGEGGRGLGPDRVADPANLPEQRIPRNAPPLFNLGTPLVRVMFADGRIEVDETRPSGFRTPLGEEMETGFSGLLSAQTMFPVLSPDEMAGHYQENEISQAVRQGRITGDGGAWSLISARVAAIPEYEGRFRAVYPHIQDGADIAFTDISNAIAAFMAHEWRSDTSPFDAYLRGTGPLPPAAARGRDLFYGKAQCATCHSGPLLTDQGFHAMAQPQLGPGKAERFESHKRDIGRMRVTGRADHAYAFRTPSLRNVAMTGPWGHAGAFDDLDAFIRHHAKPGDYAPSVVLPDLPGAEDWAILNDQTEWAAITQARTTPAISLTPAEIADIVSFLETLTDPAAIEGRLGIPSTVPSGLPIDR
jgi:cytochrome c peroxidase